MRRAWAGATLETGPGESGPGMRYVFMALATAAVAGVAARAGAQSDASVSFENRTCAALKLTLSAEQGCNSFSSGCQLALPADQVQDVDFVPPPGLDILDVKIEGNCPSQPDTPETRISGHCALNLSRIFPDVRAQYVWPTDSFDPVYDYGYMGQDVVTYGGTAGDYAGPGSAGIDISLADCEASADGRRQVCTVACRQEIR